MDDHNIKLNTTDQFCDTLGNSLKAGDLVMYSASASGRLAVAEIEGFTKTRVRLRRPGGGYSWTAGPDRIVKGENQNEG